MRYERSPWRNGEWNGRLQVTPKVLVANIPSEIDAVRTALGNSNFTSRVAESWQQTTEATHELKPDIIVIGAKNLGTTPENVSELGKPFIVTGSSGTTQEESDARIKALDGGADYYLSPVDRTLPAHIVVSLIRHGIVEKNSGIIHGANGIEVDTQQQTVFVDGKQVLLTPMQRKVLTELSANVGRVVHRTDLQRSIWGTANNTTQHYLRIFIHQLREKLDQVSDGSGSAIETEWGMGYVLLGEDGLRRANPRR